MNEEVYGKRPSILPSVFDDNIPKKVAFSVYQSVAQRHKCCPSNNLEDIIGGTAIHEMGHLFQYTLAFNNICASDLRVRDYVHFFGAMATRLVTVVNPKFQLLDAMPEFIAREEMGRMQTETDAYGRELLGSESANPQAMFRRCASAFAQKEYLAEFTDMKKDISKKPIAVSKYSCSGVSDWFAETFVYYIIKFRLGQICPDDLADKMWSFIRFRDACFNIPID